MSDYFDDDFIGNGTAPLAEPWEDPRFDRDWGTRKEVYAARQAGWDIDSGPPPHRHTVPPPVDPALGHNGIPPTDAAPLFTEDGAPNDLLLQALAEEGQK